MTYQLTRGRCACGRGINERAAQCYTCRRIPCSECGKLTQTGRCHRCAQPPSLKRIAAAAAYAKGQGFSEIAEELHISRQRVEQYIRDKKRESRQALHRGLARGLISRPVFCERCENECIPHGHHDDYSKPLDVQWLCSSCHSIVHPHPGGRGGRRSRLAVPAQRIRAIREKLGLTQVQFAAKLGVSQGTISLWESGAVSPIGWLTFTALLEAEREAEEATA